MVQELLMDSGVTGVTLGLPAHCIRPFLVLMHSICPSSGAHGGQVVCEESLAKEVLRMFSMAAGRRYSGWGGGAAGPDSGHSSPSGLPPSAVVRSSGQDEVTLSLPPHVNSTDISASKVRRIGCGMMGDDCLVSLTMSIPFVL